jgi:hypothetical protein
VDNSTSATSISLNTQYLLTVTANDVLPDSSPLQQANSMAGNSRNKGSPKLKKKELPNIFAAKF